MFYDSASRKWTDTGQSNLQIYQNDFNNTFRIVGSSRQTGQVCMSIGRLNTRGTIQLASISGVESWQSHGEGTVKI